MVWIDLKFKVEVVSGISNRDGIVDQVPWWLAVVV